MTANNKLEAGRMRRVAVHYYSGAGNTELIARKIAGAFKEKSCEVQCARITASSLDSLEDDADILGVGFPIYFREAPEMVREFLKANQGNGRPIFFFCTKGLYSGNAVRNIMELAMEQLFRPVGQGEFVMPGTDFLTLFAKKNSIPETILKSIHSLNIDGKIESFAESVLALNTVKRPGRKWYTLLDSAVKKFKEWQDDYYRDYIDQFHSNPDACEKCYKCVEQCPRNNIAWDKGIIFGDDCDLCFRCINHCPGESIQIGDLTRKNARYRPVRI